MLTRSGWGVVDLDDHQPRVFIPPEALGDAVHGDEVEVRLRPRSRSDRRQGSIERVLSRRPQRITGLVETVAGGSGPPVQRLRPTRRRAPIAPLVVSRSVSFPPPGTRVVAELIGGRDPGPARYRFIEPLSDGLDPAVDAIDIAHEIGLRLAASPEVIALARQRAARPPAPGEMAPPRQDLRHLACITIDPADAADFDDAISWRALPDGGQEVGIHIADVSSYVEHGDALDLEARERGTSVYLPGLVLPMLPEALSADAASLVPDAERAAVSVLVELGPGLTPRGWRLARSLIRSRRRLTYAEAAEALTERGEGTHPGETGEWRSVLIGAGVVARALRARRLAGGGLHLSAPDHEVVLDAGRRPVDIVERQQGIAHALVEEHMLLANRLVGAWARRAGLPILFRVHERPRWERLLELRMVLEEMGLAVGDRDLATPRVLAQLVDEAARRDLAGLVSRHVLRALEKARYAAVDLGHYGLGIDGYCHFTSPIRRYPDLHTHRVLLAAAHALDGADDAARTSPEADRRLRPVRQRFMVELEQLAEETSGREHDAQRAERLALRIACLRLLGGRLGEVLTGRVAEVTGAGLGVLLDELPVEGWVARERLPHDRYALGGRGHSLAGRHGGRVFAVGQAVRVQIERVSAVERELELGLVGAAAS